MSTREQLGAAAPRGSMTTGGDLDAALKQADQLMLSGDWDTAVTGFRQAWARGQAVQAALVWRFGSLLYLRGETHEALAVLSSFVPSTDPAEAADAATVSGWLSTVLWSLGDTRGSHDAAESALQLAHESGSAAAIAVAHVALAMVAASRGDRIQNLNHYRQALTAAVEAGDVAMQARIHGNLSSRALGDGDFSLAVAEAEASLDVGGPAPVFQPLALTNRAEGLLGLGRLDEARAAARESVEKYDEQGSLRSSPPLRILALIDLERGDLTRARIGFERAIRSAEAAGDLHNLVLAQLGLARAVIPTEPALATQLAGDALLAATGLERAAALTTYALVALRVGDLAAAAERAAEAEKEARRTDDMSSLAEALELRAISAIGPGSGVEPVETALRSAVAVWGETGNPVRTLRAERLLARWAGDAASERAAVDALAGLGVSADLGAVMFLQTAEDSSTGLALLTLGRFAVLRQGAPVPLAEWQSRKARDLLKLLVARQGRAVTREAAAELLWPDDADGAAGNRLSVALSTLRKVLDPSRDHPTDHFVGADKESLRLRVDHLDLDLARFLDVAREAESAAARGDWAVAEPLLVKAQALYAGDFLEEDQYADWSVDCREQARSAALVVSRLLARAASRRDDDEFAARHLHRLLELDPYDEQAWLALVGCHLRARHHGEARRQHETYVRRMADLGVPPVALAGAADQRP